MNNYYLIKNYSMKCRVYLSNSQKEQFDRILHGIRCAHNMALYDAQVNRKNLKSYSFKNENKEKVTIYYPDIKAMSSSGYLKELREQKPIINEIPAGALSSHNGLFMNDINKKFHDYTNGKKGKAKTIDSKIHYYCNAKPRLSYSYQETYSKFKLGDNKKVIYIELSKLGLIKIRGWNKNIRFTDSCELDFVDYIKHMQETNKSKQVTITLKKDNCNDYWIIFKLADVYVNKPIKSKKEVGIDVGVKDAIILSDGSKIENCKFKKQHKEHLKSLNKQLSRRQGYANIEFRKAKKDNKELEPSKRYKETVLKNAKVNRDIKRKRDLYNHDITNQIVDEYGYIAAESLDINSMVKRKKDIVNNPVSDTINTRKKEAKKNFAILDVSMSSILDMIEYKADWYDREFVKINRYEPSSKKCHVCGYVKDDLKVTDRSWTCPDCKTTHDRDINAAINILYISKEK